MTDHTALIAELRESEEQITSGLEYFRRQSPTHLHRLPCSELVKLGEAALAAHTYKAALATERAAREEADRKAFELAWKFAEALAAKERAEAELEAERSLDNEIEQGLSEAETTLRRVGDELKAERAAREEADRLLDMSGQELYCLRNDVERAEAELEDERWEADRMANRLAAEIDSLTAALADARADLEEEREEVRALNEEEHTIDAARIEAEAEVARLTAALASAAVRIAHALEAIDHALSHPTTEPAKAEEQS